MNVEDLFDSKERYEKAYESMLRRVKKTDSCWEWQGAIKPNGYGQATLTVSPGKIKNFYAHRFFMSEIPDGLEVDHLCHNRSCVRLDHMETVDHRTNMNRKDPDNIKGLSDHCGAGHKYTPENTHWRKNGFRLCMECKRIRERRNRNGKRNNDSR